MNSSKLFARFVKGYFYFVKTNFKKVKRFLGIVSYKKRGWVILYFRHGLHGFHRYIY